MTVAATLEKHNGATQGGLAVRDDVADAFPAGAAPVFSIVRITPDMATQWLSVRRPAAKRNAAAVAMYAQSMRVGDWVLNGMPVIISRNGVLLDGVQRLYACVEAQSSFVTVLARHVPDDTVHTIDQQRRRSFTGVLETRGVPRPAAVAGMLSKLIRYEDGTLTRGTSTPPWSRMERVYEANRADIDAAVAFSFQHSARELSEAVRTPLCFMGLQAEPDALRRFLDAIAHPEQFGADEPGVMVRRRLVEGQADRAHRLTPVTLFAVCIKALNDTMTGARSEAYTWSDIARYPRSGEEFPTTLRYRGFKGGISTMAADTAERHLQAEAERALQDPALYTMAVEQISPEMAEKYLSHNQGNRNIVTSHVSAMVRDIQNGRWMFNAQPICFARSGRLLNGQHRLSAVLESGQPIEVMVMRGLPEQAFETYDKQAKKAPAVEEMFSDFGDKPLISAAAVLLWKRENRPVGQPNARPTAAEVQEVIRENPSLMRLRAFSRKMVRYGRSSAILYAADRILRDDASLGQLFLDRFESGAELPAGHPILKLRDRLVDLRATGSDQNSQIDEILSAWQRFRKRPGIALPA